MTRLKREDIDSIDQMLMQSYNAELILKTGKNMAEIAAQAAGVLQSGINFNKAKVGIVPLTCGEGVIDGFSKAVAAIISYLGLNVFVTNETDAGGFELAILQGADIIFEADDNRFVAVNLSNRKTSDNSDATGRGYAAALEFMSGGLKGKQVLLVGAGQVGNSAALAMIKYGAELSVYDKNYLASYNLAKNIKNLTDSTVNVVTNLEDALLKSDLIYDASPVAAFIKGQHISENTYIVAPGMPLGLDTMYLEKVEERLIHDPLQIGVATMLFDVCF